MTDSFSNTEELLACVQGQQDDGDQQFQLQLNRWADAPNSIPIQNTHKWKVIKLEDVDSILDCDRVDIFDNLYSLVSHNIKHKMWNFLQFAYAILSYYLEEHKNKTQFHQ